MENILTKAGTIFNIQRPAFKSGQVLQIKQQGDTDISKINQRNGLGNYDISRRNFQLSEIKPRMASDFDKIQALDIETQGVKIQLSDKTIQELFKTKIDDKTDTQWITEKAILIASYKLKGMPDDVIERELEVNKPLGREQRKVISNQNNIGNSSNLTIADKLQEIKQEVQDGRAESKVQQATLLGQIALILQNTKDLENLTTAQAIDLSKTLASLNISRSAKQLGISPRYIDIAFYNANKGLINMFLFANIQNDPNFNRGIDYRSPIYNLATQGSHFLQFTSLVTTLTRSKNRFYLDLEERGVIN